MNTTILGIPDNAVWAVLILLVGIGIAHLLRVNREKHNASRNEQRKAETAAADSEEIYQFLLQSQKEGKFGFRSTEAISSHTKLPRERVEELCSKHAKIRRNEKERETWRLTS